MVVRTVSVGQAWVEKYRTNLGHTALSGICCYFNDEAFVKKPVLLAHIMCSKINICSWWNICRLVLRWHTMVDCIARCFTRLSHIIERARSWRAIVAVAVLKSTTTILCLYWKSRGELRSLSVYQGCTYSSFNTCGNKDAVGCYINQIMHIQVYG